MTHYLRSRHDSILIGVATAVSDDPSLNSPIRRCWRIRRQRQPSPIIFDPTARWNLTEQSKLSNFAEMGKAKHHTSSLVCQSPQLMRRPSWTSTAENSAHWPIHKSDIGEHRPDWSEVLQALVKEDLASVSIEGGGAVINSLLHPKYYSMFNSVIVTIAPKWLGQGGVVVSPQRRLNDDGKPMAAARLDGVKWHPFGEDVVLRGKVKL